MLPLILILTLQGGATLPQGSPAPRRPVDAAARRLPSAEALLEAAADRRNSAEERMRALESLATSELPVPLEPLLALKNSIQRPWLAAYVRCLGRTDAGALPTLERYARQREADVRAEAVYAITRLDRDGGEAFAREILRNDKEPPPARVAALRGLSDRNSMFARVEAVRRLATADGAVLLEALAVLRREPRLDDVPYLIDVLESRSGRPANEAVRLLQELTGYRIGNEPRTWKYFMLRHRMAETDFRREPQPGEEEPATLTYFGIPLMGERVAFVLDSSGSMNEGLYGRRGHTKGSMAVQELLPLLPRLPATGAFDVVFFTSSTSSFGKGALAERSDENIDRISDWLRRHQFEGGTDVAAGMDEAFQRDGVEEIVLLSDGMPSGGAPGMDQVLMRARQWNRWRNVRIHAIFLGDNVDARNWLARLAAENGGVCRVIQ
ncbi:MAG TPA: vWA domain-containing protein [Planctomycetota bacterium]